MSTISTSTQLISGDDIDRFLDEMELKALAYQRSQAEASGEKPQNESDGSRTRDLSVGLSFQAKAFVLPGKYCSDVEAAQYAGRILRDAGTYNRGNVAVTLVDGSFVPLKAEVIGEAIESQGYRFTKKPVEHPKEIADHAAVLPSAAAKKLVVSPAMLRLLPKVDVVSNCPVLTENKRTGQLHLLRAGEEMNGVVVSGGDVEDVSPGEAVASLLRLLADFCFATPGDHARAVAALITPALVAGGLLGGRAPLEITEADDSQAGKGFRTRLTAAVFRSVPATITQRSGGVGSFDDSLSKVLQHGRLLINIDNVRGRIDSQLLEAFFTETEVLTRAAFAPEMMVRTDRTSIWLTSNATDATRDLANRASFVRLLKRPRSYAFMRFPEGDVFDHVMANQPHYLGCVHAVVRAWHEAGKPQSDESRHDFRKWSRTLDWVVQNVFGLCQLLDGHEEAQRRASTPQANWARQVAIAVLHSGRAGEWLAVGDLVHILDESGDCEIPGVSRDADLESDLVFESACRCTGRRLSAAFKSAPVAHQLTVDAMTIQREQVPNAYRRPAWNYRFAPVAPDFAPVAISQRAQVFPGKDDDLRPLRPLRPLIPQTRSKSTDPADLESHLINITPLTDPTGATGATHTTGAPNDGGEGQHRPTPHVSDPHDARQPDDQQPAEPPPDASADLPGEASTDPDKPASQSEGNRYAF